VKKIKILIVDDDENLAMMIGTRLKVANYDVRTANSFNDAYRAFLAFEPHVVLTDIGIGDENGLDLIERIRSHGNNNVKTIYMTGDLDRYRSALVRESQLHHAKVIAKPFRADELINIISAQARDHRTAA